MLFVQPSQDSLSYDKTVSEEFRCFFFLQYNTLRIPAEIALILIKLWILFESENWHFESYL